MTDDVWRGAAEQQARDLAAARAETEWVRSSMAATDRDRLAKIRELNAELDQLRSQLSDVREAVGESPNVLHESLLTGLLRMVEIVDQAGEVEAENVRMINRNERLRAERDQAHVELAERDSLRAQLATVSDTLQDVGETLARLDEISAGLRRLALSWRVQPPQAHALEALAGDVDQVRNHLADAAAVDTTAVPLVDTVPLPVDILAANERMGEALVEIGMALGLPTPSARVRWGAPEILARIRSEAGVGAEAEGVLWMALRYALGRATFAPTEVLWAVRAHAHRLELWQRERMAGEIEQAIAADQAGMDMDIQAWQRTASALRGVCGAAWPVCEERMGTIPPADPDRWCPRCGWTRHLHPGQTP